MSTPEEFIDPPVVEDPSYTLTLTPSPSPIIRRDPTMSAIRLNGDSIFYWETIQTRPLRNRCWKKITHVFLDEMFVNLDDEVGTETFFIQSFFLAFGNPTIKREPELTRIRTYFPWLRRLKNKYPQIKFIWKFYHYFGNRMIAGNFFRNLYEKMTIEGKDLFDGIELPMIVLLLICFICIACF